MAQYVALRGLNRSAKVRVLNSDGAKVVLSTTHDTIVDVNNTYNRKQLSHHSSIGQFIVTGSNATADKSGDGTSNDALPSNT